MRPLALVLCAGLALSPFAASAAPPTASGGAAGDARCLMTMAALTGSQDQARARTAQLGVIYFAGRVKAQDPGYDFGTRLKTVAAGLNRDAVVAEAQRCGPMLVAVLKELDAAQKSFPAPSPAATPGAAKPPAKPPAKP